MKAYLDFIPLSIFLYFMVIRHNIWQATIGLMIGTGLVTLYHLIAQKGKLTAMQWGTLALVLVLGGLTLYFHNVQFILWKPPILCWLIGFAFLVSPYVGNPKQTLAQRMFGEVFDMPQSVWRKLNYSWATFQFVLGFVMLYFGLVIYPIHPNWWAYAKFPGTLIASIIFMIGQFAVLKPYLKQDKSAS